MREPHPDLHAEQAYFDYALERREIARSHVNHAPELAADPKAAAQLRELLGALSIADPDEAVAFGRIDPDDEEPPLYIGRNAIFDEANDLLVINWQVAAAAPFYEASPEDPRGLRARRSYHCRANRILDIDELVFAATAEALAEDVGDERLIDRLTLDDALLASLQAARSGELGDIVATIQAAQYEVISRDVGQLLIVQGAPGTGKTVIALHRVSWLLYNMRDEVEASDVLIVGPNPAFIRYISAVLPSLGDTAVVQLPVSELGPTVRRTGRIEPPEVRRLKGGLRMDEIIRRGVRNRERIDVGPLALTVAGRRVVIDGAALGARAAELRDAPHNVVYGELREHAIRLVEAELHRGGVRDMAALQLTARGPESREIDNLLERMWPNLTPQAFLLELFSTRRHLEAAAGGMLDDADLDLLAVPRDTRVGAWQWSADDIPLLDAADQALNGSRARRSYAYVVVDEAQDLSPMQLLSIARRSRTGWMTVLGDLAQGTSAWAQDAWEDVADILQQPGVPARLDELELAYRLPVEVHEVAMRLLRAIAPRLAAPRAVRPPGDGIAVTAHSEEGLIGAVVERVRALLGSGLIGLIVPGALRALVVSALEAAGLTWSPELRALGAPVVVLTVDEAKGLEFDNVVVVEPGRIVAEHQRGLQALFVAITRCTQRLTLVHAEPLPPELGLDEMPEIPVPVIPEPVTAERMIPEPAPPSTNGVRAPEPAAAVAPVVDEPVVAEAVASAASGAPLAAADAVQREVARAVAGALMRYATLCIQPELVPLVVEELQRWTTPAPGPLDGPTSVPAAD
jgi:DNA helicase IV